VEDTSEDGTPADAAFCIFPAGVANNGIDVNASPDPLDSNYYKYPRHYIVAVSRGRVIFWTINPRFKATQSDKF
jgi:hypothetical protein